MAIYSLREGTLSIADLHSLATHNIGGCFELQYYWDLVCSLVDNIYCILILEMIYRLHWYKFLYQLKEMDELPGFKDYILANEYEVTVEFLDKLEQIRIESDEEFINSVDDITAEEFLRLLLTRIVDKANLEINQIGEVAKRIWPFLQDEQIVEALNSLGIRNLNSLIQRAEEYLDEYLKQLRLEEDRTNLLLKDLEIWGDPEFTIQKSKVDTLFLESEIQGNFVSLLSLFDQFTVSETFPIIWIPNDKRAKSLLKIYSESDQPDISWTSSSVKKETAYISIPRLAPNLKPIIAEITENDEAGKGRGNTHILRVKLDDEKQNAEIGEKLKNFPFPLPALTALKAIFTFAIHYTESIEIILESLLLAITTNGRLARYLHILESSSTPSGDSVKMRYTFPFPAKSKSFVFRVLGNQILASSRVKEEKSSSRESYFSEIGTNFLEIRVEVDDPDIEDYIKILGRLFQSYPDHQVTANFVLSTYLRDPPQTLLLKSKTRTSLASSVRSRVGKSISETPRSSSSRSRTISARNIGSEDVWSYLEKQGEETIEDLRKVLELPANYTKDCTAGARPHIIKKNKVKEWEKLEFEHNGKRYNRLALPFPTPDNPKVYLGCPWKSAPFIGIRITKAGKEIIPCCYREDKNTDDSSLSRYLKGEEVTFSREFGGPSKSDSSILNFLQTNRLPVPLEQLLENILPTRKEKYLKLGMVRSKSSFLHAIYLCIEFEQYKKIYFSPGTEKTERSLEDIIRKQRQDISKKTLDSQLALVKETLPDRSFEEIRKIIANTDRYFDPKIFVKLIEAIFKIRVMLVEAEGQTIDIVQNYARMFVGSFPLDVSPPDTPLVIVVGQNDKTRGFMQWEPVFQTKSQTLREIILKFSTEEANLLANFLIQNIKTYQVNFGIQSLTLRENNWFNVKDFIRRFQKKGFEIIGQKLDGLGKCRVLFFQKNKKKLKFMIPVVSPLSLPLMKESRNNSDLTFLNDVQEILSSQPIQIYQNNEGELWKIQWGPAYLPVEMYVRHLPTPENLKSMPSITSPQESFESQDYFSKISQLKKTASRLEKISSFIFTKWLIDDDIGFVSSESEVQEKLEEWESNIVIKDKQEYDFTTLYGQYPDLDYPDLLDFLILTGISDGENIILSSNDVKDRIFAFIKRWMINRLFEVLTNIAFDEIPSFYEFSGDFAPDKDVKIYQGKEISAVEIYTQEKRNISLPRIIRVYNYMGLLFPSVDQSEAEVRCQNWILHKKNTNIPLEGVIDNPKIEIFDFENLKGTVGKEIEGDELPVIILLEQIPGRGAVKVNFSAVLFLGKV